MAKVMHVQVVYWLVLTGMALVANILTDVTIDTVAMTIILTGMTLHGVHRLGHVPVDKRKWPTWWNWFLVHTIGHHRLSYPETSFLATKYQDNPIDARFVGTLVYTIPCVFILIMVHYILCESLAQTASLAAILAIVLLFEDRMHAQIHLDGSSLERYQWFQDLRAVHRLHHASSSRVNFGVINLTFDVLFGTFSHTRPA